MISSRFYVIVLNYLGVDVHSSDIARHQVQGWSWTSWELQTHQQSEPIISRFRGCENASLIIENWACSAADSLE